VRKFYRDVLDYVGVTVLLKVIGVASILYVGKALTPDDFGYFAMASVVIAVGAALAEFGAGGLMVRDYHLEGARVLVKAVPLVLVVWVIETVAIGTLGRALAGGAESLRAVADHPYLIALLILPTVGNTLVGTYLVISLKARVFATATMAKSVAHLLCVITIASLEPSYMALLYATLVGCLAFLAIPLIHFRSRLGAGMLALRSLDHSHAIAEQARGGFVFFSRDALAVLQGHWNRIILSVYVPVADLGIYTFFFNIASGLSQLYSAVERACTPRLVVAYQGNSERTGQLLNGLIPVGAIGATVGCVGVVTAGELGLYHLAFRQDYLPHTGFLDAMLFLAVCGAMVQMFYFSYYVGTENTSIRTHALVNLAVSVALQLLLIPAYGLRGAIIGELIASPLRLISLWIINYRLLIVGSSLKDAGAFIAYVTASAVFVMMILLGWAQWGVVVFGLVGLSVVYGLVAMPQLRRTYAQFLDRRPSTSIQPATIDSLR